MSQGQAEGLLRKHEGHLCVRYYKRTDGTILTQNCPVGQAALRMKLIARSKQAAIVTTMLATLFYTGRTVKTTEFLGMALADPGTVLSTMKAVLPEKHELPAGDSAEKHDNDGEYITGTPYSELVESSPAYSDENAMKAEGKSLGMHIPSENPDLRSASRQGVIYQSDFSSETTSEYHSAAMKAPAHPESMIYGFDPELRKAGAPQDLR
jgi:hypothetical protein